MQLSVGRGRQAIDAIAFNQREPLRERWVRLAYRLDVNEYQGQRTPQLIVEHIADGAA